MTDTDPADERNWIPAITREGQPVLFNSFAMAGFQDQYYREVLGLPRGLHCLKYADGQVVLEEEDSGRLAALLAERTTPEYLDFFTAKCRQVSDDLVRTAEEIAAEAPYDTHSDTELAVRFTTYGSAVRRVMPFLTTIVIFEDVLEDRLGAELADRCAERGLSRDPEAYLEALLASEEPSRPSRALVDLYDLGARVDADPSLRALFERPPDAVVAGLSDHPEFRAAFESYLDEYDFMEMEYYAGEPLQPAELVERVREVAAEAEDQLDTIERDRARTAAERERALDDLDPGAELRQLVDATRAIHRLRQYRADALFEAGRHVRGLLAAIGGRLGLSYDDIVYLTHDEIADSIRTGDPVVDETEVAARRDRYAIVWEDQERSIATGSAVDAERPAATPETATSVDATQADSAPELTGNTAFEGSHRGPVAVVTDADDVEAVDEGDVLVSPMTDPYFVPAMVRAGAIVTDEGGILSHAAIVARELGIPCVVGTEAATSVLDDGTTVVVDASEQGGVVRPVED